MAGKYGSSSWAFTLDDGPGGTSRTITPYVKSVGGIKVEQLTEMTMPFGQAYETHTPVGVQRVPDVELEFWFDTTATTGPHVVCGTPDTSPQGSTRTFTASPGDSKTFTIEVRLVSYEVIGVNGGLTMSKAVIRQAGLGAWT